MANSTYDIRTEILSLRSFYRGLWLREEGTRFLLEGKLGYCASYDRTANAFVLNPATDDAHNVIRDTYEIRIDFPSDFPSSFPSVREVGGRIDKIMKEKGITDERDLHVSPDNGIICLCVEPEKYLLFQNGVSVVDYLNRLVVPYFYGLSYFQKRGKWPWGFYSHRDLSVLESYLRNRNPADTKLVRIYFECLKEVKVKELFSTKGAIQRQCVCPCGKPAKFRNCHRDAFLGARLLKEDYDSISN